MSESVFSAVRSVSPSLLIAERRDRARRNKSQNGSVSVKRSAASAMTDLDDLASDGQLSSQAYIMLAKSLKVVHDATCARAVSQRNLVAMEFATEAPYTLIHAPADVDWFSPVFVRKLAQNKQIQLDKGLRDVADPARRVAARHANALAMQTWLADMAEHYIGPVCAYMDADCRFNGLFTLLEANSDLFGEVCRHLLETELDGCCCCCELCDEDDDLVEMLIDMAPCLVEWSRKCDRGQCVGHERRAPVSPSLRVAMGR